MTVPAERTRAVQRAQRFLTALMHKTLWEEAFPGIPWPKPHKTIRDMARSVLRHYPYDYYLKRMAELDPKNWDAPDEKD